MLHQFIPGKRHNALKFQLSIIKLRGAKKLGGCQNLTPRHQQCLVKAETPAH